MTTFTHRVRGSHNDWSNYAHTAVTLPAVPGVEVTTDRSETAPRTKTIRTPSPASVALQEAALRRAEWVRQACREIRETDLRNGA